MPALDEGIKLSDEALAEMIAAVYRGEWDIDAVAGSRILDETRAIFRKAVDKGVPRSKSHRKAFKERLNESVDVFSTFRVHNEADEIARMLTDEEGRRRTFRDWAERVQPYLNHQNRAWLQTEYSTAIRRAHDEAEWERFREDADIYPNLEWMPSTSAQPGADHKIFWGTVLSKDDPFWSEHRPGDRWNCKCSLRQTDKEADKPGVRWKRGKGDEPQAGLRTKPGSGEIFSDDHPYFPKSCGACPYGGGKLRALFRNLWDEKNCFGCQKLRATVDRMGGGSVTAKEAVQKRYGKRWNVAKAYENEGYISVEQGHGAGEMAQNLASATPLAKAGMQVELIKQETKRIDGRKKKITTRDANVFNSPLKETKWEFKYTEKYERLSKSMGTKAKQAVEQGAAVVLIDIVRTDKFTGEEVIEGVFNSFNYNAELKGVCVMIESEEFVIISRDYFLSGSYVDKIKNWLDSINRPANP